MRKLFAAVFGVAMALTGSALAADLQGRWQFQRQGHNGTYVGTMVINQNLEVRLKGTSPTQNYSECGYVQVQGSRIDVVFTTAKGERGGYSPDHFYCALSGGALACHNQDAAGNGDPAVFTLVRLGGVPATSAERLEDVCPPGPTPRS